MDEHNWLTSSDPQAMLSWYGTMDAEGADSTGAVYKIMKMSDRKLRLFACACVRQVWDRLADNDRKGIVLAEMEPWGQLAVGGVAHAAYCSPQALANYTSRLDGDRCIRYAVGWLNASVASEVVSQVTGWLQRVVDTKIQANILRDIVGNPYRVIPGYQWQGDLGTPWLRWLLNANDKQVWNMAGRAYELRDYAALPVIADAIEDLTGEEDAVTAHLRSPGPHYRGCWVVDLLLGKE